MQLLKAVQIKAKEQRARSNTSSERTSSCPLAHVDTNAVRLLQVSKNSRRALATHKLDLAVFVTTIAKPLMLSRQSFLTNLLTIGPDLRPALLHHGRFYRDPVLELILKARWRRLTVVGRNLNSRPLILRVVRIVRSGA